MNSHDDNPIQILRYIHGELGDQELVEFHRHLRVCNQCQRRVEEEKDLSRLFRETSPLYIASAVLHARVAALSAAKRHSPSNLRTKLQALVASFGDRLQQSRHWGAQVWLPALCTAMIAFLCLGVSRFALQEFRARDFVQAAVTAHRDTLNGQLPLQIQSDAPETVTRWASQQVSFHFRLPVPQDVPKGESRFMLTGARLVELSRGRGVMVVYHRREQTASLLIAPASSAIVAGGDEVQDGELLFHYRNHAGFNVITWSNHGLAYALVSSVSRPARQSCLVCHGSLPAH